MRRLRYLFLQLNTACNLRCIHCDFWRYNDTPDGLSDDQLAMIIEEFAYLSGGEGAVVTCGGEPLLVLERYFRVAHEARARGLRFLSVTNGSLVKTGDLATRVVTAGPTEITISMDGPDEETHDRLRGARGSFEVTKRAVRRLVEAREATGSSIRIYVMSLVSQAVVGKLDLFYDLALRELGVDKLKLNLMQPTFGHAGHAGPDSFFAEERIVDVPAFMDEIRRTDQTWGIERNPEWQRQAEMYLQALQRCGRPWAGWSAGAFTPEHICDTYDRNVMVDDMGYLRLCFSPAFPASRWTTPGDLQRYWEVDSLPTAERMRYCNRYCGISHSVRREPATLRRMTAKQLPHQG